MKWNLLVKYGYIGALFVAIALCFACTKAGDIITDDYPDPMIFWTGSGEFARFPGSQNLLYEVDEQQRKIWLTLGISSSGMYEREAFTVNVALDGDTVSGLQREGLLQQVVAISPEVVTAPATAEVAKGKDGTTIRLGLDIEALAGHEEDVLAFGVRLEATSAYAINPKLATVIVLVDYKGVVGIACPDDTPDPGRVFFSFESDADMRAWGYGGMEPHRSGDKQVTITRNNDDGWGSAVKWDQSFNVDTHPFFAMRVYDEPEQGAWLLKFYNGLADYVLRPSNGEFKQLDDGSRIYYWNFAETTGLSGEVNSNIQVVIEGPNGQSLTYGWLKTYREQDIILQCVSE